MSKNHEIIFKGFRILLEGFAPYIAQELRNEYGEDWWSIAVMGVLYEEQKRDLPATGAEKDLINALDVFRSLLLFDLHWQHVFRKKLALDYRTWAKELVGVRNKHAHQGAKDFSTDYTWRALDTMSLLLGEIHPKKAEEIRKILRELRYGTAAGSTTVTSAAAVVRPASSARVSSSREKESGILSTAPTRGLPSWRDVMEPHPDVAEGRYQNAEFAADLAQVARGEGAFEYRDPVEFFARTYMTEGMSKLLEQSLRRISGNTGDPIIQLKTSFGGGKTHSMLALYHLLRGRADFRNNDDVKEMLQRVGLRSVPEAHVVVLVGTALDPAKGRRPATLPGITINTLWGEIAAQLAESTKNPSLYEYVREADKKGVSPGSLAFKELFDASGACLIMMDELVAYAKKLYGANNLVAGTFDNFTTFIQELTEGAGASKKSLVVASIPESDIEIGGEAGQLALESIEHTFGRKEAIWTPVRATEGFEVVRRRLFLDCKDTKARDAVCTKFSKMYSKFQNDFPTEAGEADYFKRLQSCYPIHPEVFERLYGDWATLDRFQRTRGVLRLMAAVIHELWMGSDAGLMIMPGSLPLDRPNVRDELTRYLSESWNAVVDGEIDGRESVPFQTDQINQRFGGVLAARRVARTIMLGSAPTRMEQNVRGIESSRIRLGVVQPDENIATFNDALSTLTNTSAYLYSNPTKDRYWYDTRPTLRKMAEDRATQQLPSDVEFEIENRLQRLRVVHPFAGVHASPPSSFEVPDEQRARLVILAPKQTYNSKKESSPAQTAIVEMLEQRGKHPRIYRNMLAFVAADEKLMEELNKRVRYYLAWKSIKDDGEQLDLDKAQKQETENNLSREDRAVDDQINDAYCHLFVPYIDRTADLKKTQWDIASIKGGSESIVAKAGKRMLDNEQIIAEWAPMLLRMELDNLLWKEDDHISVKKLWEYLCSYGYLSRLAREDVLFNTIRKGVASSEFFAYAAGFDNTRYVDLKLNQAVIDVDRSGYLVKIDVAKRQLEAEGVQEPGSGLVTAGVSGAAEDPAGYDGEPGRTGIGVSGSKKKPKNTGFFLSTAIDRTRIGKEVQQLYEEVIKHLEDVDGATLDISLELTMKAPEGVPQQVVRTVIENCNTLKVKKFGFSD